MSDTLAGRNGTRGARHISLYPGQLIRHTGVDTWRVRLHGLYGGKSTLLERLN